MSVNAKRFLVGLALVPPMAFFAARSGLRDREVAMVACVFGGAAIAGWVGRSLARSADDDE